MSSAEEPLDVVTGAFGFTGRAIAARLLARGRRVRTLTGHPPVDRGRVDVRPYRFDDPRAMAESLRGAHTLYNTYWARFPEHGTPFGAAVENTRRLVEAAGEAGVARVVHLGVANASEDSPFDYYRGKALAERAVTSSGLSHAVIRPILVFGSGDLTFNNIAWLVRRFPLFAVPSGPDARIQPVHVGDVADLAVDAGGREDRVAVDAAGPEVFAFEDLVRTVARILGTRTAVIRVPAGVAMGLSRAVAALVRDEVLTRDELGAIQAGLMVSGGPPTAPTRLSDWLARHADALGRRWRSYRRRYRGRADREGSGTMSP